MQPTSLDLMTSPFTVFLQREEVPIKQWKALHTSNTSQIQWQKKSLSFNNYVKKNSITNAKIRMEKLHKLPSIITLLENEKVKS